ncbi:preprotein translocase subunit SecG [Candidatus Moduliflexota bacterium]
MTTLILIVHVVVSMALILIVLLQTGKGAEMGASFGGSNQTVFGSQGSATFLSKVTTAAAILFMLTSLTLAVFASRRTSSVMKSRPVSTEAPLPVEQAPPPPIPTDIPTEVDPAAPALPEIPQPPAGQ